MDKGDLEKLAKEEYCYLTTKGRVSGKPHRIEIWFGTSSGTSLGTASKPLYLLSGGGLRSDWIKNLQDDPAVTVRVGKQTFDAKARIVKDSAEEQAARELLATKYYEWQEGKPLNDWARTSVPVALDLKLEE